MMTSYTVGTGPDLEDVKASATRDGSGLFLDARHFRPPLLATTSRRGDSSRDPHRFRWIPLTARSPRRAARRRRQVTNPLPARYPGMHHRLG
jgi:hypothetical protein